jgi:hypothetical protein
MAEIFQHVFTDTHPVIEAEHEALEAYMASFEEAGE